MGRDITQRKNDRKQQKGAQEKGQKRLKIIKGLCFACINLITNISVENMWLINDNLTFIEIQNKKEGETFLLKICVFFFNNAK